MRERISKYNLAKQEYIRPGAPMLYYIRANSGRKMTFCIKYSIKRDRLPIARRLV